METSTDLNRLGMFALGAIAMHLSSEKAHYFIKKGCPKYQERDLDRALSLLYEADLITGIHFQTAQLTREPQTITFYDIFMATQFIDTKDEVRREYKDSGLTHEELDERIRISLQPHKEKLEQITLKMMIDEYRPH